MFYVNAETGIVAAREKLGRNFSSYIHNLNNLAANLAFSAWPTAMSQPQINASSVALKAQTNVGIADTQMRQRFGWASSDFPNVVRVGINWDTANGRHDISGSTDYLRFGKANPPNLNAFSHPLDIVTHEYAHGISARSFGTTGDEAGALDEAFADFAASVVDVSFMGSPASATWLVGDGLYNGTYAGKADRSFRDPFADSALVPGAVGVYKDWYPTRVWGGTSSNSTIASHAYYLLIHGGFHARVSAPEIPAIDVPEIDTTEAAAEVRAREVFFRAYRDPTMALDPTFFRLKAAAMGQANTMYGTAARTATKKAFEAVGVGYQCSSEPAVPNPTLEDLQCDGRFVVSWPDVAGADRYIVMVAPQLYGWSFAQVTTDGDLNHCMTQVANPSMLRMVACNSCGCSNWSSTEYMPVSPGPCP